MLLLDRQKSLSNTRLKTTNIICVKIKEDSDQWDYSADDSDHLGQLQHQYQVQRTDGGLKLQRKHYSEKDAYRFHEKTMHYDHQGTLHIAEAKDRILFKDRTTDPIEMVRLPGELPHKITVSGDFPDIEASVTVRVNLVKKRLMQPSVEVFSNLTTQTLEIKLREEKHHLEEVEKKITDIFECLRLLPDKDDLNRSVCVNELRDILQKLQSNEYSQVVQDNLGNHCQDYDMVCKDRRLIFIDIVTRIGDVTSQSLLLQHVLSRQPPVNEELRRIFIHCAALENPIPEFVHGVEAFCFGKNGEHHGTRTMIHSQSRACLAVGSLMRHLNKGGQGHQANRLADKLESWLEDHGKGDSHVSKRDTWLTDTENEDHHISKGILLHALGNAALPRSRAHLLLHAQPNRGHQVWRRAALDGLRHYSCTESANAMLESLLHEEKHSVRQMALNVYTKHPRRKEVSREFENDLLSRNYTYPSVARVKREMLEKVLFKFKLQLPTLDWKKEIGTRDVGASFGIYFENGIDILFKVLSGYVDINIHDKAWAEIHIGLINMKWDILLIEICYKGRLSYNMNIIKDFSVGQFEDISTAFGHFAKSVFEPVEKVANDLATKYHDPSSNETKSGFKPLAQAVKRLPEKTELALKSTINFTKVADAMGNHPIMSKIKQLARQAQSLMEDIHGEATNLFVNIGDVTSVVLPFAEKEIFSAINIVLGNLDNVSKAPQKVVSTIERAKMGYTLAMQRILQGNNVIKQATSFLTGSRNAFMNAGQEQNELIETTKQLMNSLRAYHLQKKIESNPFDEISLSIGSKTDKVIDKLYAHADDMVEQLSKITTDSVRELQRGFDIHALYTEILMTSFEAFKEAIDMVKSRITALFGLKFHPKFPNQRRDCDDMCKCGYFPTDCTRYGHPGIELKLDPERMIYSPVAGMMSASGVNAVLIEGKSVDFKDYKIFLSNIHLTMTLDETGTFVDAGQIIGTPLGKNGCKDSHIHLAMKRKALDSSTGLCDYVDPSPFLNTMQPIPTWNQECKEFTLKHIGQVVDFNNVTGGFQKVLQVLKSFALDVGKHLLVKAISCVPDTGFIGTLKPIAEKIVEDIDLDPANLKNLFKNGVNSTKNFIKDISSNKFNLNKIVGLVKTDANDLSNIELSNSLTKMINFIDKAKNMIQKPVLGNLKSMATGVLGRLLLSRGAMSALPATISRIVGSTGLGATLGGLKLDSNKVDLLPSFVSGLDGMMTALKASTYQLCPSFGNALADATNSVCVPHTDCLGIDCDISFQSIMISANVDITLKVYPEERKVTVTSNGKEYDVSANDEQTLVADIKVFEDFQVKFKVGAEWQGSELSMSLSALACTLDWCLQEVPVIKNIRFDGQSGQKQSIDEEFLGPFLDAMESQSLDGLLKMFSDLNLPVTDILNLINGIQESTIAALKTNDAEIEQFMEIEFQNPFDYKDSGSFPVPGENGEVYLPFFVFKYVYPMGPFRLTIDFSAGGALGVSLDISIQALDSLVKTTIKPWVSGKIEASLTISSIVAKGGVQLDGYLMRVRFPLTLSSNYAKQPIKVTKSLDVDLIPVELILKAWVKVELLFPSFSMNKVLWHWTADPIRTTIWNQVIIKNDFEPPRFPYCDRVSDQCANKQQIGTSCSVIQLTDRHPSDAAFKLEFAVEDEDSDLNLWYAVGDYPGGTNIIGWTEMRGTSLVVPAVLPCGIPLYFLVRARNSQQLESTANCSLPTYDCTLPDGRVDATYICSSHSNKISATLVLFEDSQLQHENILHAVGYSPGSFGHEVVDWLSLNLSSGQTQSGTSDDLRYFSQPQPGRLANTPKMLLKLPTVNSCASKCIKLATCVSFSYSQYTQSCEMQQASESPDVERNAEGHYQTYERLGKVYRAVLKYENLSLQHGTKYFINVDTRNVLGYQNILTSQGTMIDFTPPDPGNVGEVYMDEIKADGCNVSLIQRCVDAIPGTRNHRKIIDGPGSSTVFNGNRRGQDIAFTIENYQASANWNGFKDEECGIHGYTWAVGTTICGTDIVFFSDPHATILNPNDWTNTGLAKNLHLPDGKYYVTVQAVSDIQYGGDLVTTVCHSKPFVVDTTPPSLHSIVNILFDEIFTLLVVYYNASDDMSGIASMELGLGKTKHDVMIQRYQPLEMRGQGDNTYLVNEEFKTDFGVPVWIRLKVINNVGLSVTGSSDAPILLDSSAPVPGHVMDGSVLGQDICCQKNVTHLCAQWADFYDPDSNIDSYEWGVGLMPQSDDVAKYTKVSSITKQSCAAIDLIHNTTYYSTVIAHNMALNSKSMSVSSNGVLIDITPPVPGTIVDGSDINDDMNYTSETATITASWVNFYDPESGLAPYSLSVFVNGQLQRSFSGIQGDMFTDSSFYFHHGDTIHVELQAINRAGGFVIVPSNGMLVDHTPPELVYVKTLRNTLYQHRGDILEFVWNFQDHESGIAEYRCIVYETLHRQKNQFWPTLNNVHTIPVNLTSVMKEQELYLNDSKLQNGAMYSLQVTAINRAKMATSQESKGVIVDTTPPVILQVSLARLGVEEELNENNEIEHLDQEPLTVSWLAQDSESGIKETHVCITNLQSEMCVPSMSKSINGSLKFSTLFEDMDWQISTDENRYIYQAIIVVINGAGISSNIVKSKNFIILKASNAGKVIDGRMEEDIDFSRDKTSVAMSFSGFSSEACGIDGYEWGIGTTPFTTDVLSYTSYGLVENQGIGYAEAHIMLFESHIYYSTVRAKTGANCHEEYIVSSSDGFALDTIPPQVKFQVGEHYVQSHDVLYQTNGDSIQIKWVIVDPSGISESLLTRNVFELNPQTEPVPTESTESFSLTSDPLSLGETFFSLIKVKDNADNKIMVMLPPVTIDFTPPSVVDLNCTQLVSTMSSWLTCTWLAIQEIESSLKTVRLGLGSGRTIADLLNMTSVPLQSQQWALDVEDIISSFDFYEFYVIMHIENAAGNRTEIAMKIVNDMTPPLIGSVFIVTSPRSELHSTEQKCQTAQNYIEVLVLGLQDNESYIQLVEIALGSSKGRTDIRPFYQYPVVNGLYTLAYLSLNKGSSIYATIRATNTVGLYTIAYTKGIIISPEPHLEVKDGPDVKDVDGQSEINIMQGSWSYSDPCPLVTVEWAVRELGGKPITNFTTIPDNGYFFYNDMLLLENFITYVNFIRVTDALNRTFTAFSDGVTVIIQRPDVSTVRDGLGNNDLDFQEATDHLSANWDDFGNIFSTLPSDHIVKYEAAVGTNLRSATTHLDIHTFKNVGLATNVTFLGLNLTAKTVTYFITVRAHSAAGSFVESSSDGIKVGYSTDVTPGQVHTDRYQSSNTSIKFTWSHFESDMVITHFYAGVSTRAPSWDNNTDDCMEYFQFEGFQFDIFPLKVLVAESMTVIEDLKLIHGKTYYVTIIAEDKIGHCSAAVSDGVVVDTTPPNAGVIHVEGFIAQSVIFLQNKQTIIINLDNISDPESYIYKADVELVSSTECNAVQNSGSFIILQSLSAINENQISIRNLDLEHNQFYYLKVTVLNGAGLERVYLSKPIILDTSPPQPGVVKLGTDWTAMENIVINQTNLISGMIALKSFDSHAECITQVNILSPEFRKKWTSISDEFTSDCFGFENEELYVTVRHSAFLTGLNRGAAQFTKMPWREGDYVFYMTPASGENIVTGISLASPSFLPPFLDQNGMLPRNQSSLPCDSEVDLCMTDRNDSNVKGTLMPESDYGIGLTFIEENFQVKLLFWVQDHLKLKKEWIPLEFDPKNFPANYSLKLKQKMDNNAHTWEVSVALNSKVKGGFSGLVFPGEFVTSVYTWNLHEFVPPVVDVFTPFSSTATVRYISVPTDERPLCSYGSPFQDVVSGIKDVLVGVSDDVNQTANIAPFKLLKSFCIPCLMGCSTICSNCHGDNLSGDYIVLPLVIDHLSLDAANEVKANNSNIFNDSGFSNASAAAEIFDSFKLPTYYLDVRVVSHNGLYTDAKSVGLIVDISPPVINFVHCFDPEYSYDETVVYLGNNHTVGASWDMSEDISGIKEIWICLGTQPGYQDIVPQISLGLACMNYTFQELHDKIKEGGIYYITVVAQNKAGLLSKAWSNFTVYTTPPDMTAVRLVPENVTVKNFDGEKVVLMESTVRLELNLEVDPTVAQQLNVEYFEWAIGTTDDKDDLFPRTRMGLKNTKKIAIVNGFIQLDNMPYMVSIGDYASRNYSSDTSPNPTANKFSMEPGRCLKQRLYGISKAFVASFVNPMPICIKRSTDIFIMGDNSSHTITKVGSTFIIDRNLTGELHIKLKVSKGAVLAGLLDDTDLDTEYGTSASTNFSPFIVHPALSKDKASRWLRKRLFSMPGPHMFLSPITKTQLDSDVEVTYVVPTTIDVPLGGQVTLLFWNSDAEMWQHPDEICSSERNHYNESTRLLTTRLCAEVFSYLPINAPYKPDTATSSSSLSSALWILGPRMLTMSVILSVSTNLPPFIQSTSFTLMEDSDDFNFTIIYTDDESDKVEFILREQPKHGTATVSSDGKLLYRPQADFCGTDIILLTGKEILDLTILALGIMPNMFNFSVTVQVKSVNDPPSIFYLPSQNDTTVMQQLMTGPLAGNGINITVLMQGNTTAPVELGVIAFNDVDSNDSLSFIKRTREVHDVSFEVSDLSSEDPWLSPINLSSVAGIGRKKVILHFTQNFSGHVEYDLRIKDAFDAFSRQLIINVYILMNPCIHGHCQPKASPDKCEDPKRAFTFGPYLCHCDLGYEGEWCQTETDECLSATCGPISYCIDLIGDYRCDNRILVAIIIICSILSLVAAVFGIFVFFRLKTSKTFTLREPSFSSGIEMQPISRSGVDDQYTFATSDSRLETIQSMVDMYCSPTAAEATVHSLEALQQTDRELDESSEPVKNAPSAEGHSHQIPPISTHIVVKF